MATKSLKQIRTFNATAKAIYEALMDSKKHAKFTGGPAKISTKVGGAFSVFGGYATGTNLELKENKKIVQSWRGTEWPAGHYSKITFSLASAGKGKTKLTFTQSGIPESEFDGVKQGWIDYYWTPLAKMLEKS
jgi:activator of HSP90 ATPase